MSLLHTLVTHCNVLSLSLIVIGAYCVFALVIAAIIHLGLRKVRFNEDVNEELRQVFTISATLFAIVLGFLTVVTWEQYVAAEQNVVSEANSVQTLYREAALLDASSKATLQHESITYASSVIHNEWPLLESGKESTESTNALNNIWSTATALPSATIGETADRTQVLTTLTNLSEQRRTRLYDSRSSLAWFFWVFLFGYSLLVIVLLNSFRNHSWRKRSIMSVALGVAIGSMLLFILLIDYPFAGTTGIKPDAFQYVLTAMQ